MPEVNAFELDIEQAIIDRLATALDPLPVENLPKQPWNFTHPLGTALVMLTGMDAGATLDVMFSAQELTLSYEVLLLSRSLKDHSGLYPMWLTTRTALLGWTPAGANKPLKFVKLRPQGYQDGAWMWAATFSTEAVLVPNCDLEEGPLLQQIGVELCDHLKSPNP